MDEIIRVENLTKQYGERLAVDHLSFGLNRGQILGLLGPNGAGKTTTMRMLTGLSLPTSGRIEIFGLNTATDLKKIHSQIGVVFDQPNLLENLSAYQNLALFCKLYGQSRAEIKPLLQKMDLWARAHDPVKHYSKGMRQRVLLLRALVHHPRLLFLDEPASGLDPLSSKIIWDYLQEEKRRGLTVVLTSHDMEEIDQLCDQIGFINHGRLITAGETAELKQKYGHQKLKVIYRQDDTTKVEIMDPSPETFSLIRQFYEQQRIISIHSMEASLTEIFHKLSQTPR